MLTSILRTLVPYMWGIVIGWVLSVLPILEPLRDELLAYGDAAVPVVGLVIVSAWYVLWRKLEPRLPDWLIRAVLGSAKAPTYVSPITESQVDDVNLTDDYIEVTRGNLTIHDGGNITITGTGSLDSDK